MSPFDWAVVDIKHGPRGTRHKKLHNLDPIQLEGGPKGLRADISSLKRFRIRRLWLAKKVSAT
jgi:hypothetical protein